MRRVTLTNAVSKIGISRIRSGIAATGTMPALQLGRGQQRRAAEERPEEQAAAVAHEDRRRANVVDQEPERRADKRGDRERQRARAATPSSAARRKMPAMAAMPADSPSMLSSRLKALVMPTIQTSDSSASSGDDAGDVGRRHQDRRRSRR